MLFFLMGLATAKAASLDNVEVGGAYGTPLATNPTALWWNPSGLAAGGGTRFLLDGEPTLATVTFERDDPYNGGTDSYQFSGVVPFAGIATDAGVKGLGLGVGMGVPFARGGGEPTEPGPGSFAMRSGSSTAIYLMGAVAYKFPVVPISLGLGVHVVQSSWIARVDSEVTTSYDESIQESGAQSGYTDAQIESPDYTSTLQYSPLTDRQVTFNAGMRLDLKVVSLGATFAKGVYVNNQGDVDLFFGCPPGTDAIGRFGSEQLGLCDVVLKAHGSVGYQLPSRIHGGLAVRPSPKTTLEVMGGYVFWSQYTDFDIVVEDVEDLNTLENDRTAGKVNHQRQWARANVDSWWTGLDVKADLGKNLTLGGRVLYDKSAIPEMAVSPNNYDADVVSLSAFAGIKPNPHWTLGLQAGEQIVATRVVDESAFLVTLDGTQAPEDRWFYPQMNGTYSARITRFGVSVQGRFGVDDE